MKYVHNEAFDKTVRKIVRQKLNCSDPINIYCENCPFLGAECTLNNGEKQNRVIEYIAEEVAEFWEKYKHKISNLETWQALYCCTEEIITFKNKYPVDEATAKEIADAARVLLLEADGIIAKPNDTTCKPTTADEIYRHMAGLVDEAQPYHPTIADAFYVYNADLQKCVTVSIEQDDCIVDITIHNELDIDTARVFCEKLSSFLQSVGGEK